MKAQFGSMSLNSCYLTAQTSMICSRVLSKPIKVDWNKIENIWNLKKKWNSFGFRIHTSLICVHHF